jgi:uncharacterized protein (TIGR02996 family)
MNAREMLLALADEAGRDPLEGAFLRAIADDPDDDATRAAYADWLEESGRTLEAEYLRLDVERGRTHRKAERFRGLLVSMAELERGLSEPWISALKRPARVLNCGGAGAADPRLRFTFLCPNRWGDLTGPPGASVRFCGDCRRNVFMCSSVEEAEDHARKGDCIAISSRTALDVIGDPRNAPFHDVVAMGEIYIEEVAPEHSEEGVWAERLFQPKPKKPWWKFW